MPLGQQYLLVTLHLFRLPGYIVFATIMFIHPFTHSFSVLSSNLVSCTFCGLDIILREAEPLSLNKIHTSLLCQSCLLT